MTSPHSHAIWDAAQVPATPHWHRNWAAAVSFLSVLVIVAAVVTIGLVFSPAASHRLELSSRSHQGGAATSEPRAKYLSGCTLVPMTLARVVHQTDGTTIYDFTGDGTWSDESVPPPGFDPLTATDAQLAASGFPPRPAGHDAAALAAWKSAVGHSLHAVVSIPIMAVGKGCAKHGGP